MDLTTVECETFIFSYAMSKNVFPPNKWIVKRMMVNYKTKNIQGSHSRVFLVGVQCSSFECELSHESSRDVASCINLSSFPISRTRQHFGDCSVFSLKMTRVFIGRLAMNARESDVEKFLRGYGKLKDISLKRGYGFVVRERANLFILVGES